MKNMEIEKKFTVKSIPENIINYSSHKLEQGYLNVNPAIRVRKEDDTYYMTYKGKGFLEREEYNLPLTQEAYEHLIQKADGTIIRKTRYFIPYKEHTIELDIFEGNLAPLIIAEVEFDSVEMANAFQPPEWFDEDVTEDKKYSNSYLSQHSSPKAH